MGKLLTIPWPLPNFYTFHILAEFRTCKRLLKPGPHRPNSSLSLPTRMQTLPAPPTAPSHLSVAGFSLWETATKSMDGWVEAAARKERKVFLAKGQPQWRRKVRKVGFLLGWEIQALV